MPRLPFPFSRASHEISCAISDGRTDEALHKLVHELRASADDPISLLAADWIEALGVPPGGAKKLRKGRPASPEEWLSLSGMVRDLQADGCTYEQAVHETARHFDYGVRHVQKCVQVRNALDRADREIERELE